MLTKYLFFIIILVLLVVAAKKSVQSSEHFEDVKKSKRAELEDININEISNQYVSADGQTVELIENKELIGSFKLDNIDISNDNQNSDDDFINIKSDEEDNNIDIDKI